MSRVVENDTDLIESLIAHAIPDLAANSLMLMVCRRCYIRD